MEWSGVLVMLVVFVVIGASIGAAWARAQRQWDDYRKTRDALPGMRKTAWALSRVFASKTVVIILIVVGLICYGKLT